MRSLPRALPFAALSLSLLVCWTWNLSLERQLRSVDAEITTLTEQKGKLQVILDEIEEYETMRDRLTRRRALINGLERYSLYSTLLQVPSVEVGKTHIETVHLDRDQLQIIGRVPTAALAEEYLKKVQSVDGMTDVTFLTREGNPVEFTIQARYKNAVKPPNVEEIGADAN